MDALSNTLWDVVICGTGLAQSLLALSLSRSGKKILHIDPNEYYGGPQAALSLQEAEQWASKFAASDTASTAIFSSAVLIAKPAHHPASLSPPRAYSLALAPQIIHARSQLLAQLVSSRAYRQLEFLAVGSFFVAQPSSSSPPAPVAINRVPSTREDVFTATFIPSRAKRALMKVLKFVLDYEAAPPAHPQEDEVAWRPHAHGPLDSFLERAFGLDSQLRALVLALTLSLDGRISVRDGLAALHRHLTSTGFFGPGFAAVYPKWGGAGEMAQVGCRAGAVGGAVYMLGTGIQQQQDDEKPASDADADGPLRIRLTNSVSLRTKMLVRACEEAPEGAERVARLVAVVPAPLPSLFEVVVEEAPAPAVAVVVFPAGSVKSDTTGHPSPYPIHVMAHSSDTGECPAGQSLLYLTTLRTPDSKELLQRCLRSLLEALAPAETPSDLYQLYYEQARSPATALVGSGPHTLEFPIPSTDLAFQDSTLEPVHEAWKLVVGQAAAENNNPDAAYMDFQDREGVTDEEDV